MCNFVKVSLFVIKELSESFQPVSNQSLAYFFLLLVSLLPFKSRNSDACITETTEG